MLSLRMYLPWLAALLVAMSRNVGQEHRSHSWTTLTLSVIVGPLAVALLGFALTRSGGPLNPDEDPVLGGEITDVEISSGTPCCIFSVGVELNGFNGEPSTLEATIVDAYTGDAFEMGPILGFEAEADSDRARWDADVPIDHEGTYYVRFTLYDNDGVELDREDSATFDVAT